VGDGLDLLLWLAIMVVFGLRGAARSKRLQARQEPDVEQLPEARVPRESPQTRPVERKPRGLRGRWAEIAAELERQIQSQQQAPETRAEPTSQRTVLVPGHRVEPRPQDREPSPAIPIAPVAVVPSSGRRRSRGLAGLERYDVLKRTVILSELLGTPPGHAGSAGSGASRWET